MIAVSNLSAGYGSGDVLHGVNFTLPAVENLSVLGPNGCGKSTLLKCIAGILPYSGEVLLEGKPVKAMKRRQAAAKIALMGQTLGAAFDFNVFDTVMQGRYPHLAGRILRQPTHRDVEIAEHSMEVTGVQDLRRRPVTSLSGGQLQRVFLARTLAQQPSVILLDEPTNHLDLKYQAELVEYLVDWSKQPGKALVGVFHDVSLALALNGHVLLLQNGKSTAFGPMQTTLTAESLQRVYGMDVAAYMRQNLQRWEAVP